MIPLHVVLLEPLYLRSVLLLRSSKYQLCWVQVRPIGQIEAQPDVDVFILGPFLHKMGLMHSRIVSVQTDLSLTSRYLPNHHQDLFHIYGIKSMVSIVIIYHSSIGGYDTAYVDVG